MRSFCLLMGPNYPADNISMWLPMTENHRIFLQFYIIFLLGSLPKMSSLYWYQCLPLLITETDFVTILMSFLCDCSTNYCGLMSIALYIQRDTTSVYTPQYQCVKSKMYVRLPVMIWSKADVCGLQRISYFRFYHAYTAKNLCIIDENSCCNMRYSSETQIVGNLVCP